mgnify:CR=1 FL=1
MISRLTGPGPWYCYSDFNPKEEFYKVLKCCLGPPLLIEFGIFLKALIIVSKQKGEMQNRLESLKILTSVNNCGDQFTNVPVSYLTEIDSGVGTARASLIYISFCFAASVLCLCILIFTRTAEVTKEDEFKRENTVSAE